jgi:hypothetical protein
LLELELRLSLRFTISFTRPREGSRGTDAVFVGAALRAFLTLLEIEVITKVIKSLSLRLRVGDNAFFRRL